MVLFLVANCSLIQNRWTSFKVKNGKFHKFLPFFNLTVKSDPQTYKTCTFLESTSNLLLEKVPCYFLDQNFDSTVNFFFKIFNLHGPFARRRSQNFLKFQNKSFVVILIRNFQDPRAYEFLKN
jgi:hypothetical protein